MQKQEESHQDLGATMDLDPNAKKRHSEEMHQEDEASLLVAARKKRKEDKDGLVVYISEVEETTREWSQTYK